jgi:hypothetical protein
LAEQYSSDFEIGASGKLQDAVAARGVELVPHLHNLLALSEAVGTPIPLEPRVLLLVHGQLPCIDIPTTFIPEGTNSYVPKYRPGDIVAYVSTLNLTGDHITHGIATALAEQERRRQTLLLNRAGGAAMAAGAAVSGVGEQPCNTMP